jgi:hypothetical protein
VKLEDIVEGLAGRAGGASLVFIVDAPDKDVCCCTVFVDDIPLFEAVATLGAVPVLSHGFGGEGITYKNFLKIREKKKMAGIINYYVMNIWADLTHLMIGTSIIR